MGTYSLVPKKKTKVLKQRTMLEMFKELQQSTKTQQKREVANINGEKVVNASEEDESEDLESEEEMRRQPAEQTLSAVQETSESAEQVGEEEMFLLPMQLKGMFLKVEDVDAEEVPFNFYLLEVKDEHESEDSEEEEDEGEEDGTESDLSFESSLKKKLKKKSKADSAWLRPSRKRKRRTAPKEPETDVLPQTSGQECTQILPSECVHLSKSSHTKEPSGSAIEEAQELPLCSCRMETPKSREILILADRKCMATESMDGQLTRCQSAVLKHEMMRPSNSVQLLVLCEDHRNGMVKHQCCPGCGFFCRAGTFMECQPDVSISHRFHRECASMLKGQSFCPHCGEEASKAKEVTIAKADTTSTVPPAQVKGPATLGAPEGRADTTTGSSSCLAPVDEVSGRADSSLSAHPTQDLDDPAVPGSSRQVSLQPGIGTIAPPTLPLGTTKETLESVLVALDTEKTKKLRFHPKQLYLSAKQGELKKVVFMLGM
ncbi:hypothetical protein XENORESO_010958 [Xenotaenia resolanae]|uniref:EHMT1/2 cysteine-rich region domain-containing protein n=1 Tax=Xenotaenia resolanae TaxID=208358 RepID=A0ABV0WLA4_9TELE